MAATPPTTPIGTTRQTGAPTADRAARFRRDFEMSGPSKPGFLTSEFILAIAASLCILAAAAASDNFQADEAWPLIAYLSIGYMISRGLAKVGGFGRDGR